MNVPRYVAILLKENMSLATLLYIGIEQSFGYTHYHFVNMHLPKVVQEWYIYCKMT